MALFECRYFHTLPYLLLQSALPWSIAWSVLFGIEVGKTPANSWLPPVRLAPTAPTHVQGYVLSAAGVEQVPADAGCVWDAAGVAPAGAARHSLAAPRPRGAAALAPEAAAAPARAAAALSSVCVRLLGQAWLGLAGFGLWCKPTFVRGLVNPAVLQLSKSGTGIAAPLHRLEYYYDQKDLMRYI